MQLKEIQDYCMKNKTLTLLFILLSLKVFSDSAQPGVWGAGGTGGFRLLYTEDSLAYKKIQMKKEFVSIQLYKGYAVVKGEYWMYNATNDTFQIRTGYPLNSDYELDQGLPMHADVLFDSLSQLRVFVDSQSAKIISSPPVPTLINKSIRNGWGNVNWYVWVTKFKPRGYTKIDVYFIVNTNHTQVTGGGYERDDYNGFIYILESGATWKQPIEQGTILIQLMDNIDITDIHGIKPPAIFTYNKKNNFLKYSFSNLRPTPDNNIILTYCHDKNNLDFRSIAKNAQTYFQSIDKLSQKQLDGLSFSPYSFNSPNHISSLRLNPLFVMLVGVIIIFTIFILLLILIIKRTRKRGRKNP